MGRINIKDLDRYEEQSQKPQKIKKRKNKFTVEDKSITNYDNKKN
jgi:hypothetical protein